MLINIFNWCFQMCIDFNPGRVKEILKQRNLKIIDVAKQLKISPSYLSRKLRGERYFRPEELALLAKILEVDVQDFFLNNDEKGARALAACRTRG